MSNIVVLNRLSDQNIVAEAWERLRRNQLFFFPDFDSVASFLSDESRDFRVLSLMDGNQISCLACFVCERVTKSYKLGDRTLFSLPVRQVSLFGSAILGNLDDAIFDQFLKVVCTAFDFDLISFGSIPIESALYRAARARRTGFFVTGPLRKTSIRWLIKLPKTFDEYLAQLSSKLRQTVKRKMRKIQRDLKWEFRVIHQPEQVEAFLRDAEGISRMTYQWHVGDKLRYDEATRRLYTRRATRGQLRCYIVYASGTPCAFLPGVLTDKTYYYGTPGYDPQYSKLSPGLVLLMWAIQDLIEQKSCEIFDFGPGGDAFDYKSRFANLSSACDEVELGRWSKPYSVAIMMLQECLNATKNLASWILGQSKFRQRLKRNTRKYGES